MVYLVVYGVCDVEFVLMVCGCFVVINGKLVNLDVYLFEEVCWFVDCEFNLLYMIELLFDNWIVEGDWFGIVVML